MQHDALLDLMCPAGPRRASCGGRLLLGAVPPPVFDPHDPGEIAEGVLTCDVCAMEYPILCGLALLLPDMLSYLRRSYGTILRTAVEHGLGISRPMLAYLHQRGADIEVSAASTRSGEDGPRALANYLKAHFDPHFRLLQSIPPEHPLAGFLRQYQEHDLYRVMIDLAAPYLGPQQVALDIGCHVGRMSGELAARCARVYGLDHSFLAVFTARRVLRGWPTPLTSYEFYRDGLLREARPLDLPLHPNAELLVASGLNLPFRPAAFDVVNSTNVLDVIGEPETLLQQKQRVLKPGGLMLLSTPYHSGSAVPVQRALGSRRSLTAAQALSLQVKEMFEVLAEIDLVPWVLGEHERRLLIYLNHCLVGRKRA